VNAHQRRKYRRQRGIRPPYTCLWCRLAGKEIQLPSLGKECPGCGTLAKPLADWGVEALAQAANKRGYTLQLTLEASGNRDHSRAAAGRLLIQRISAISEDLWCANWMQGCEYVLWRETRPEAETELSHEEIEELQILSILAQGWPAWIDEGPKILPWLEWFAHLEAQCSDSR
jgi:hypothetical protein